MRILKRLIALLGLGATATTAAVAVNWPDLPTSGYLAGRAATLDDMKLGNAAFTLDGKSLRALPMTIPQYVWWTDDQGKRHPMILVQAEEAPDGTKIVGLRDFVGGETVATLPEIEMLGTKKPTNVH